MSVDVATPSAEAPVKETLSMPIDMNARLLADDLIVKSAMLINADKLEEWSASFEADGRYIILPRENRDIGYPIALIKCETRDVLDDRITVLRAASKFNPHVDRHILSRTLFTGYEDGIVTAETNFTVVQSSLEGVSKLFCAGTYEDRIRIDGDTATFVERVVVLDTFSVPNLIATPL